MARCGPGHPQKCSLGIRVSELGPRQHHATIRCEIRTPDAAAHLGPIASHSGSRAWAYGHMHAHTHAHTYR